MVAACVTHTDLLHASQWLASVLGYQEMQDVGDVWSKKQQRWVMRAASRLDVAGVAMAVAADEFLPVVRNVSERTKTYLHSTSRRDGVGGQRSGIFGRV